MAEKKLFYLFNGKEQIGPFTKELLQNQDISKDTPVWFEGLNNWSTIGEIEELNDLISNKTISNRNIVDIGNTYSNNESQNQIKLLTFFIAFVLLILSINLRLEYMWWSIDDYNSPLYHFHDYPKWQYFIFYFTSSFKTLGLIIMIISCSSLYGIIYLFRKYRVNKNLTLLDIINLVFFIIALLNLFTISL